MKQRPILMSAPMVRAILAGTKTQTRRVVKRQPADLWPDGVTCQSDARGPFRVGLADVQVQLGDDGLSYDAACQYAGPIACPYGKPGDRLWVREAHSIRVLPSAATPDGFVWYRESDIGRQWDGEVRWKPSIHMPRWASRILLEIVAVRVERLQDISPEDAEDEGTIPMTGDNYLENLLCGFRFLWESINGSGSWAANPWVWVVEFKRVTP